MANRDVLVHPRRRDHVEGWLARWPDAIPTTPEVEVRPVNLGLSGPGGVEGGAGVVVQEHVGVGSLRRAADRQLGAELLGGEPGVEVGHGSGGCRGGGSGGGSPRVGGGAPRRGSDGRGQW